MHRYFKVANTGALKVKVAGCWFRRFEPSQGQSSPLDETKGTDMVFQKLKRACEEETIEYGVERGPPDKVNK